MHVKWVPPLDWFRVSLVVDSDSQYVCDDVSYLQGLGLPFYVQASTSPKL